MASRRNTPSAKKAQFSKSTLAFLQMLDSAVKTDAPFQEADGIAGFALKSLVQHDFVMQSDGIDGTVKYKITGRGQQMLKNGDYYLTSEKKSKCETCVHRQVLDQVRERCPDVDTLFVAMEALIDVKSQFNGGSVQENIKTIHEINMHVETVEQILKQLE